MNAWLQFKIVKAARMLELASIRRKLTKNRAKLETVIKSPRMEPYKSLLAWIDRSKADVQAEMDIWKQARDFDHLHELDIVRATEKIDQFLAETSKYLGVELTIGVDPELDKHLMEMLEKWEERIEK